MTVLLDCRNLFANYYIRKLIGGLHKLIGRWGPQRFGLLQKYQLKSSLTCPSQLGIIIQTWEPDYLFSTEYWYHLSPQRMTSGYKFL